MLTHPPLRVLIVDDEPLARLRLRGLVEANEEPRAEVAAEAGSGEQALAWLKDHACDLILLDVQMPGLDGLGLAQALRGRPFAPAIVFVTAHAQHALQAFELEALDYLTKPVKSNELVPTLERAIREAALRREVAHLRRAVGKEYSFHQILGKSKAMRELFDLIQRVSDSPTNILISGESGTGKELVAKAIHFNSDRKTAPFIPVNCAAIPETLLESELFGHVRGAFTDAKADKRGLFEEANQGTLFLDEISEIPTLLQAKLLRAIQEKEVRRVGSARSLSVDVRIIAATNLNLAEEVKAKRFREDLYYRLNVIEIRLPPLRERREDIPLLVEAFLQKCAQSSHRPVRGVAESALALLIDYAWPGNVRELENVIERAVTLSRSEKIGADDLPPMIQGARGDRRVIDEAAERTLPLNEVEKEYILRILEKTGGNKYQAANILGIDRKTLYRKLGEIEESKSHG